MSLVAIFESNEKADSLNPFNEHAQLNELESNGFTVVENVLDPTSIATWIRELDQLFDSDDESGKTAIKNRKGAVYAARNILSNLPGCCDIAKLPELTSLLTTVLGPDYGLVRGLYFDKHPDRTWSLPWHKDLTIAVQDNSLPSNAFSKPTNKSGVDHVEASESVLARMLTLRIHLDPVTEDNGPLEVAIGSHLNGKLSNAIHNSTKILVGAGDVLAMRPMLSHMSKSSAPDSRMHRRILHLEFAADRKLPDGYDWHQFL
ncbi:MAG: phytanoyl-CoA dioxygenase family protein [Mariniblastus sp.]